MTSSRNAEPGHPATPPAKTTAPRPSHDLERWAAVLRRDSRADGAFFYAVRTTGVFCRPGCRSRLPRRANVRFFPTATEAQAAGYRPCKRCQPELVRPATPHADCVVRACRLLERAAAAPSLAELARSVGVSPYHFHRLFQRALGVTPKQYADAWRRQRLRTQLRRSGSVTQAVYEAGFGSSSRAYDRVSEKFGLTPGAFRRGAAGVAIRFVVRRSSLGWVLVAATDRGVCAIDLDADRRQLRSRVKQLFPRAKLLVEDGAALAAHVDRILDYIASPRGGLKLPLDIQGTAFQQRVWQALQRIPVGETASYGELARAIGVPGAGRAVGRACAANPIAMAVPCHRAVRADGRPGGYRWGPARKRALLEGERHAVSKSRDSAPR